MALLHFNEIIMRGFAASSVSFCTWYTILHVARESRDARFHCCGMRDLFNQGYKEVTLLGQRYGQLLLD